MSTPSQILRGIVCDAITAKRRAGQFVINDFEVEETYLPADAIPDVPESGMVWLEALTGDDSIQTRELKFKRDIPVRVSLQKVLVGGNPRELTKEIDLYEELEDQLRDAVRLSTKSHDHLAWVRTEGMRDAEGKRFNFQLIRQNNLLLAQFTSFFEAVLE